MASPVARSARLGQAGRMDEFGNQAAIIATGGRLITLSIEPAAWDFLASEASTAEPAKVVQYNIDLLRAASLGRLLGSKVDLDDPVRITLDDLLT